MRAVVVEKFCTPSELRVTNVPEPPFESGRIVIDVRAAGCNFFDTLIVQGKYQEKPPFPFSPGGEIAGVVRHVGAGIATTVRAGDLVMANVGYGGFRETVAAPPERVHPMPNGMPFEEAAGFPIVYGTAYSAVVHRGGARPGETVVVTAAAGGVGLAAVQIAKAVGARVIALSSGDKLAVAQEAGADVAIDYRQEGWVEALRAATGGTGADVVIENVGGDVFEGCLKGIAWGGRIVVVGFTSGHIPELRLNRVLLKHISVIGLHLGPMYQHELPVVEAGFRALASLYTQRRIAPVVSQRFPLEQVAEALGALGSGKTVGKIVLTL
jgi:NADPH2:quinone reductase